MANIPDMKKIRIIELHIENMLHLTIEFQLLLFSVSTCVKTFWHNNTNE